MSAATTTADAPNILESTANSLASAGADGGEAVGRGIAEVIGGGLTAIGLTPNRRILLFGLVAGVAAIVLYRRARRAVASVA